MKNLLFTFFLILILTIHVQAQKPLTKPQTPKPSTTDIEETDIVEEEGDETEQDSFMYSEETDDTKSLENNDDPNVTPEAPVAETPTPPPPSVHPNQNLQFSTGGDRYRLVPFYTSDKPAEVKKILKNGTKIFAVKQSPQKYSGGLRVGPFNPVYLNGDVPGVTFRTIYPNAQPVLVAVDFEYQFFKAAGKLGIQGGVGFFTATGNGRLKTTNQVALEVFTLVAVPMNVSLMYHLQFWDKQPLVPFAGVGADYFGMLESRDDRKVNEGKFVFGGAPAWHWVAGAQLQLDWLDREVIWQLDHDYGINHIYLTGNVRQVVGLNSIFDFSALYYEGGFLFEF